MKRILILLLTLLLAVSAFSGCGEKEKVNYVLDELDLETEEKIKNAYKEFLYNPDNTNDITVNSITIWGYYGTYDEAIIVKVMANGNFSYPAVIVSETIAGVTFEFTYGARLIAYKKGKIYPLKTAYEE